MRVGRGALSPTVALRAGGANGPTRRRLRRLWRGWRTLATLLGPRGARALYAGLLIAAATLFAALVWPKADGVAGGGAPALARRFVRASIERMAGYELLLALLYAVATLADAQ